MELKDIESQVINYLQEHNIKYNRFNDEINCACLMPDHNDDTPSMYINLEKGVYYCFGCQAKGTIEQLLGIKIPPEVKRMVEYRKYLEELEASESEPVGAIGFSNQMLPPKSSLKLPNNWRGVSNDLWDALGVYICDKGRYKSRVILPSYSPFDFETINGFDARIIDLKDSLKPFNPKAKYLRPSIVKTKEVFWIPKVLPNYLHKGYVVITEGVIDAISLLELGEPAIANYGLSPISQQKASLIYALGIQEVKLGLDLDTPAYEATPIISKSLKDAGLSISKPLDITKEMLKLHIKDYNDYLQYLKSSVG